MEESEPFLQNKNDIDGTAKKISISRLQKQIQYLKSMNRRHRVEGRNVYVYDLFESQESLQITLPDQYPFYQPLFSTSLSPNNQRFISQVLEWSPKLKVLQIVQLLALKIKQQRVLLAKIQNAVILKPFFSSNSFGLIIIVALLIRVMIGLGHYSGQGDFPNLGDFQAHRNWMAITLNRHIQNWYVEHDTQPWWRIDYPPIAAYISFIFGKLFKCFDPQSMKISRGYQSTILKLLMRCSVLLVDFILIFPFSWLVAKLWGPKAKNLFLLIMLLKPDAILIDHGHFQYNCLILGLILGAIYFIQTDKPFLTCILFTISLHAKQMSTYYALAFVSALAGLAWRKYKSQFFRFISQILVYGLIVMIVSVIIWLPWLGSMQNISSVINAIFPVHRGLYQLKVPNFWCISDTFMQYQKWISKPNLLLLCALCCVSLSMISMVSMFLNLNKKSLIVGFSTISMSFFMFSYHVHEKSILLPLLLLPAVGVIINGYFWLQLTIAGFMGLFHLLIQDKQQSGYFGIMIIYILIGYAYVKIAPQYKKSQSKVIELHNKFYDSSIIRILFFTAAIGLHLSQLLIEPPKNLPYLHNLLFAGFSFCYNSYFLILTNLIQLQWIIDECKNIREKRHT